MPGYRGRPLSQISHAIVGLTQLNATDTNTDRGKVLRHWIDALAWAANPVDPLDEQMVKAFEAFDLAACMGNDHMNGIAESN